MGREASWSIKKARAGRLGMRENPDGFPSSHVRLRRRRCSHSGIRMGLDKSLKLASRGDQKTKSRPGEARSPRPRLTSRIRGIKKARAGRFLDTGSELGCGG